jgi:hypothetical protein
MIKASSAGWIPLGWALALGLSLVVTGCGGRTIPSQSEAERKVAHKAAPPSTKASPRGKRGQMLAEGGDLTAQERRAARLKARKGETEQSQ